MQLVSKAQSVLTPAEANMLYARHLMPSCHHQFAAWSIKAVEVQIKYHTMPPYEFARG